jgi:hypothetical protein
MAYLYLILKLAVLHPVVVIFCLMLITIITIALALRAGIQFLSARKQSQGEARKGDSKPVTAVKYWRQ